MNDVRKGRPTESPKDYVIRARVDLSTVEKLDYCVEKLSSSRSDIIRQGVDKIFSTLTEKK